MNIFAEPSTCRQPRNEIAIPCWTRFRGVPEVRRSAAHRTPFLSDKSIRVG
jgi:hypothetical protein